ncbi:sister chromatid cohesion C-terminus-domain-containing protein, partial [Phakopsora pachyrhizi]
KDCTADLVTLVEDIMEADDLGLESPSNLFCRIDSEAVLTPTTLSNLISLIERSDGQTISQLPLGDLSRLIKILGRGVRIAEELIVIPPQLKQKAKLSCLGNSGVSPSALKNAGSRKHGKAPKSRSKRNPKLGETNGSTGCEKLDQSDENGLGIASMDDFCQQADVIQQRLGDLSICLKSINATLSLLVRDKFLPKQFYSEELVRSIMLSIKNQLSSAIYPFIEAGQKESNDAYLRDLGRLILTSGAILDQISSSFSFISTSILPKVDLVVDRMELSESILIHVGYIAVGPFSVNAGPLLNFSSAVKKKNLGDGSMKNMRLGCLKLLKTLSSKYPDHRNWMVDEILSLAVNFSEQSVRSNMTVYHLSNGKSIQTVSALLLHIVQSCLTGCKARVAAVINSGKEAVLDEDTSNKTPGISSESNKSLTDRVKECVEPGISSAAKIGIKIISFLMQKSGKTSRSTHETCYRVVFERLVEDLINLLFLPDWPVAEFMLGICCKTMVGLLEGTKSSAESNAVKGLCLDHLGSITARLIEPLGDDTENLECTHAPMISFKSLLKNFDRVGLSRLFHLQKNVLVYLATISHADSSFNSSTDFAFGQWIFEIVNALKNLESEIKETDREHDYKGSPEESRASSRLLFSELQSKIEQFAAIHFEPCTTRQTRHLSDEFPASLRHGSVNEAVSGAQGLKGMTKVFLERILSSSASPSTTFRSKAIRALGLVVAKDPNVFFKDSVRSAIENRMLDSSPAVRDATIELLGKYVVSRPDLAVAFLPQISARIADKGVSVRRRVVKLLKAIYMILNDEDWIMLKVEISHKLISRINDEENSIKELAMNSIEDLWFSHSSSSPFDPGLAGSLIMKIATSFCDLPSPLESVMKFMFNQNGKKGQSFLETFVVRCREIVDHLIDQLMDVAATSRDSDFNEVECVKTICILSSSCRKLLNPVKASILLPYLKGATTPSEQALVQYLLKIFRACALEAPKSSGTFGQQLQNSLLVLVNKPNFNVGGTILQELISCFCAVIKFQTHDYGKLLNVFKACNKQLSDLVEQLEANTEKPNLKPLPLLMHLVSTLAAYGDFEQIPSNYKDVREGFRAISEQPMHLYVYKILVQIYHNEHVTKLRGVAIICLGFLYRSFPKLMTRTDSLEIMDGIFKVNAITEVELQHRLIKVIAEFIEGQAEQLGLKNELDDATGVDMGQLIGNCEGFEDSGVSSAIVQRYLRQITSLAQSVQPQIQKIALDIISYTVKQGLAHPLECVPVLVSLESSLDESFSKKAFGLHRLLHVQRANLVHSRFLLTMEQVYEYHSNPGAGKPPASGYVADPPRSVMGPWYQLLSEKRVWKIEFLKAIVKKFYIDPQNANVDLRSVLFARYLAEGLLTLDFKTEEELLIIITSLNESIGQYAYQTLQLLEGDQKKSLLELLEDEEGGDTKNKYNFNLIGYRVCVALGIAFVLRDLLKDAFGISDKKALKFMVEFEKTKNKKVRETPAHRKISLKELCLKFDQYLKLKIPGLSGDEETFQLQARAFANMVREDFDVKDSGEHGMLDEESGQEEQDDSEDGADGDDGNMQID